jgi:hypothetical protein
VRTLIQKKKSAFVSALRGQRPCTLKALTHLETLESGWVMDCAMFQERAGFYGGQLMVYLASACVLLGLVTTNLTQ